MLCVSFSLLLFGSSSSGSCTKKTAGAGEVHCFMQFTWKVLYRFPDVPKSTWYVTSVILLVIIKGPYHWFSSLSFLMGLKTRT